MTDQQDAAPSVPVTRSRQGAAPVRPRRAGEYLPRLILGGGAILMIVLIAGVFAASLTPSAKDTRQAGGAETAAPVGTAIDTAIDTAAMAVLAAPDAAAATSPAPSSPAALPPLEPTSAQPEARRPPPIPLPRLVLQELTAARRHAVTATQADLQGVIDGNAYRLHTQFLPGYLSFLDRKLGELKAYNLFALDWAAGKLTGQKQDRSTPSLMADFEAPFLAQVVAPVRTRQELTAAGDAAARRYAVDLEARLLLLKQSGIFPAADWQALPPLSFTDREGRRIVTPVAEASAANPAFLAALGGTIGDGMATRFERAYKTLDVTSLTWRSGHSIFRVGSDVWIYYGTFIVYWIGLFLLLRSQLVPINVFGALLGWVLWELFSWSSWLGYEWWQYEHTRNALEPLIVAFAEDYFAQLAQIGADMQQTGTFRSLHQIEAGFAGR